MKRNYEKEKLLLEYLISSVDIFVLVYNIIKDEYFDPELRNVVKYILSYYQRYSSLASTEQILAETGFKLSTHQITSDKIEYVLVEIEKFCKIKEFQNKIMEAAEIADTGSEDELYDIIKKFNNVLNISISRNLGIDFFKDDVIQRLKDREQRKDIIPSGYTDFDNYLNGGPLRKSIIIFCGVSGGGKSLTLQNFALNYSLQGKTVLYLSFELFQDMIDERFMIMVSNLNSKEQIYRKETVSNSIKNAMINDGSLLIKYLKVGSKVSTINTYLKEFELEYNKTPDVICVDYIDCLSPNEKVQHENLYLKHKFTTEELRQISVDYNCLILTASQLNRASRDAKVIGQGHIAGGISKIEASDVVMAVNINKKTGDCFFQYLKSRSSNADNEICHLLFNPLNLRITNNENSNNKEKIKSISNSMEKVEINENEDFLNFIDIIPSEYD